MARIQFKAKVQDVHNVDGTLAYRDIKVPELKRHHCDMAAFRQHPKYGAYANSDLFPAMLKRIKREVGLETAYGYIRLDRIPAGVTVDTSGFLATVSFDV